MATHLRVSEDNQSVPEEQHGHEESVDLPQTHKGDKAAGLRCGFSILFSSSPSSVPADMERPKANKGEIAAAASQPGRRPPPSPERYDDVDIGHGHGAHRPAWDVRLKAWSGSDDGRSRASTKKPMGWRAIGSTLPRDTLQAWGASH